MVLFYLIPFLHSFLTRTQLPFQVPEYLYYRIEQQFLQSCDLDNISLNIVCKLYLKKYYPNHKIVRTVVLYGSTNTQVLEKEVGFLLKKNGEMVLNKKAPSLFAKAIKDLLDLAVKN